MTDKIKCIRDRITHLIDEYNNIRASELLLRADEDEYIELYVADRYYIDVAANRSENVCLMIDKERDIKIAGSCIGELLYTMKDDNQYMYAVVFQTRDYDAYMFCVNGAVFKNGTIVCGRFENAGCI